MSEVMPVTAERARAALEDMDDYARMDAGVDAKGPRETLARFIADHERVVAELRMRAERAEACVAELEAENARLRDEAASALALLARMRAACGDDGRRMQDELEAYLRELRADAERLDFLDQCREGTLRLDGPRLIPAYQRWGGTATHKDARAAIDAARQQENA